MVLLYSIYDIIGSIVKGIAYKWGRSILWGVLCTGIGVAATFIYLQSQSASAQNCIKKYSLTSHTLDCADYEDSAARLRALGTTLDDAIAQYKREGKVTRVSVWVRDLQTKQWAASNELDRYAPASLLKVPLMLAYYKLAEIQPTLLDTPLVYAQQSSELNNSTQDFKPSNGLVLGNTYTVEQLIEHMIINSDNNAAALLLTHIDQTIFDSTMVDLGVKIPGNMQTFDFLTAKTYGNIFRTLYNASYLNRDFSEKALELMSSSTFKGIAEPLPTGVVVSHKFGEREVDAVDGTSQSRELHDCGIVYKGDSPYSLCIMTEGRSFDDLLSVIKDLSAITYQQL